MKRLLITTLSALLLLLVLSCEKQESSRDLQAGSPIPVIDIEPIEFAFSTKNLSPEWQHLFRNMPETSSREVLDTVELASIEYYTMGGTEGMKNIILFSNTGNKQVGLDFLPGDPRDRTPNQMAYYVDTIDLPAAGLSGATTLAAINRAMGTWDAVKCSDLQMVLSAPRPRDYGIFQFQMGFGGRPGLRGDIQHGGFLGANFFNAVFGPQNGPKVLAFTVTYVYSQDINQDGKPEVSFREIYYNKSFNYGDGQNIDIETIALHESGHALSQAHFGKAFVKGNGQLQFSPAAIMNAGYTPGVQPVLKGTDIAGHCSLWANWPNN